MKVIKKIIKISIGSIFGTMFGLYYYIDSKSKSNSKSKLNIIFDLDETIIHTDKVVNYNDYNKANISIPESYEIYNGRKIWIRPGVYTIIPILSRFNNLYLFTKATEPYAQDIMIKTNLDKYFKEKKFRDDCKGTCKDINKFILFGCNKSNTILVDDKISNRCESQNFYHIPKYNYFIKNDNEIIKLFCYILWINIKKDLKNWIGTK